MRERVSSCRIALLGFGTVGSAVARRLAVSDTPFQLTHVLDRGAACKRDAAGLGGDIAWTADITAILHSNADIVVEAIGGLDPAAEWIRPALLARQSVVPAYKHVIPPPRAPPPPLPPP